MESSKSKEWVGFDLDGTLAQHGTDKYDPSVVGEPVGPMLKKLKDLLKKGVHCKIFTARVGANETKEEISYSYRSRKAIKEWCLKHVGQDLEITATKDYKMIYFYDDRAVQVEIDTGKILGKDFKGKFQYE